MVKKNHQPRDEFSWVINQQHKLKLYVFPPTENMHAAHIFRHVRK